MRDYPIALGIALTAGASLLTLGATVGLAIDGGARGTLAPDARLASTTGTAHPSPAAVVAAEAGLVPSFARLAVERVNDIPVVDLRDLRRGLRRRDRAARAIVAGAKEYGMVFVRNHGVDFDAVDALYREGVSFFNEYPNLPESERLALDGGDIMRQRGYSGPGTEHAAAGRGRGDLKENFFASIYERTDRGYRAPAKEEVVYPELFAPNRWPAGRRDFQRRYLEVGRTLQGVGEDLLRGLARGLGAPKRTFASRTKGGAHVTRLLRYLPLDAADLGKVEWGGAHADFNALTLLPGGKFFDGLTDVPAEKPGRAGLYLMTPDNQWKAAKPEPGLIIAQFGQQLEWLTGGQVVATPHFVAAPDAAGVSRMSLAHFVHLAPRQVIEPIERVLDAHGIVGAEYLRVLAKYKPVDGGSWAMRALEASGLAPKGTLANHAGGHLYKALAERIDDAGGLP